MKEITKLAHSIALAEAVTVLDCHTVTVQKDGEDWFDTDTTICDEKLSTFLAEELRYLELRGALVRHPVDPRLVRIVEVCA
jgi:hypothetical protein